MKILRDLRLSTKLLILLEITRTPRIKLRSIADKIGISVQGVSEYIKIMINENLVEHIEGEYRATNKGVQFLHNNFTDLKKFVDNSIENLNLIDVCGAIAKTPIKKGETVGLFMENGFLTAYSNKKSNSIGTAEMDAMIDEDVPIKNLKGIVELNQGKLCVIEIPSIRDGGSRNLDIEKIIKIYKKLKPDKIAVLDVLGIALAKKVKLVYDFEFGVNYSIIDAVQKGLDVLAFGTLESVQNLEIMINESGLNDFDKFKFEKEKTIYKG